MITHLYLPTIYMLIIKIPVMTIRSVKNSERIFDLNLFISLAYANCFRIPHKKDFIPP